TSYSVLALDSVDAGVGDTVLIVQEGWSASTAATGKAGAAIDSAIVGVVDRIDLLTQMEDPARGMAERIARRVASGGTPSTNSSDVASELAAMRATLNELQNKLI